jgi:hypothetical protein
MARRAPERGGARPPDGDPRQRLSAGRGRRSMDKWRCAQGCAQGSAVIHPPNRRGKFRSAAAFAVLLTFFVLVPAARSARGPTLVFGIEQSDPSGRKPRADHLSYLVDAAKRPVSSSLGGAHKEPGLIRSRPARRGSGFEARGLTTKAPLETGLSLTGLATEVCLVPGLGTGSAQPFVRRVV